MDKSFTEKIKKYSNFAILAFILLFFLSLLRTLPKVGQAKKSIEEAVARVEKKKKENEELNKKLEEVQSQAFIERQLRDKLGLVKEGEIIVVLPDDETLRKLAPEIPEEEETLPDPIWKKWAQLFGLYLYK